MTTANNKKEYGFSIYDAYHSYAFLNNKTGSNNSSEIINLIIVPKVCQVCKRKNYDYKKTNHSMKMISKKKLEKSDNGLVVKINQMQTHHSSKKENCESVKTDDTTEIFP